MFDYLYNSEIVDVVAYGVDEFDYTPNLIGFGTSIGETGYMEMRFSRGTLFFSTDGITETMPVINYYRDLGVLYEVNEVNIDEVTSKIRDIIEANND